MVSSRKRRALAALALAALAGCAADDGGERPAAAGGGALLTPWLSIDGGWTLPPLRLPQAPATAGPRRQFIQPVGVAAAGDIVLVADAGARTVWRLDRSRDAMAPFAPFSGPGGEQGASLQLGGDLSAWMALPAEHAVVQYDAAGRLVRRWRDDANVPRPVAVAVAPDRSQVLVGDGATAQVAVFTPLGQVVRLLGGGPTPALQSIAALALGPAGLYVLDRLAQQVVVLGPDGAVREVVGEHQLVHPRALAVDASGRVFVGDDGDHRVKVFRGQRLLASVGGFGHGPGRFGRIEALAVDGNLLYVADSVTARVQVLLVAPPSMEPAGAAP